MKKWILVISALLLLQFVHAQNDRKLVIISFDGYRWEDVFRGADSAKLASSLKGKKDSASKMDSFWSPTQSARRNKLMPFLWTNFKEKGQLYGNRDIASNANVKNRFWFSYPGYNEIFSGYPDSTINSNDFGPNPNQTVLEYINRQGPYKNSVAAFTSWAAYDRILNKARCGFPVNAGFRNFDGPGLTEGQKLLNTEQHLLPQVFGPNERHDAVTYLMAKEYLKENHPKVLYIAFIETDAYAHRDLYDMYLASGRNNDRMIEDLWTYLQSDPFYKGQTSLMLVTDHGRGDNEGDHWTHHNRSTPGSDQVWMGVLGPRTPAKGEVSNSQIYQFQYARTMAALLGLSFPSSHPIGEAITNAVNEK